MLTLRKKKHYACFMGDGMTNKTQRLFDKDSYAVTRGHDFVEIGGVKWATCNLGAENPKDPGMYFRWGDNKGVYLSEVTTNMFDTTKPVIIEPYIDAAKSLWGGKWRIPTPEDFSKLKPYFYSKIKGINGEASFFVDGTKMLLLPLSGFIERGIHYNSLVCGYYWTNYAPDIRSATYYATGKSSYCISDVVKSYGFTIRPVLNI